jgi:molybdopterin-guanine dinucleotide biosynthesis protein A
MIARSEITALVLAGGQGTRMGGADKGLLPWHGVPLALQAARRLQLQARTVAINANRHLADYRAWGFAIWPDADQQWRGPLAGLLAGLQACTTAWLACVPCDCPRFPLDLVARLAQAGVPARQDLRLARAQGHLQPLFALVPVQAADSLAEFLGRGGRRAADWFASHAAVAVDFDLPGDDPLAFTNLNTPHDWTVASAPRLL